MTQEALKQMYQLLLTEPHAPTVCLQLEAIAREALAQPEQEPEVDLRTRWPMNGWKENKSTPPQRTWVGLTKEQISEFDTWHDNREEEVGWVNPSEIVAYIDAKLKQKNGYAEEKNT
jgi:hypothetical protein